MLTKNSLYHLTTKSLRIELQNFKVFNVNASTTVDYTCSTRVDYEHLTIVEYDHSSIFDDEYSFYNIWLPTIHIILTTNFLKLLITKHFSTTGYGKSMTTDYEHLSTVWRHCKLSVAVGYEHWLTTIERIQLSLWTFVTVATEHSIAIDDYKRIQL